MHEAVQPSALARVAGAVLGAVILAAAILNWSRPASIDLVDEAKPTLTAFISAINDDRHDDAHQFLSADLRAKLSPQALRSALPKRAVEKGFPTLHTKDGSVYLTNITTSKDTTGLLTIGLSQGRNGWRVDHILYTEAPRARA